jgi:hypothetical protein
MRFFSIDGIIARGSGPIKKGGVEDEERSEGRSQRPECRSANPETRTAKDAKNAKKNVIPTGAKRSGGISRESAANADGPEAKPRKQVWQSSRALAVSLS